MIPDTVTEFRSSILRICSFYLVFFFLGGGGNRLLGLWQVINELCENLAFYLYYFGSGFNSPSKQLLLKQLLLKETMNVNLQTISNCN